VCVCLEDDVRHESVAKRFLIGAHRALLGNCKEYRSTMLLAAQIPNRR